MMIKYDSSQQSSQIVLPQHLQRDPKYSINWTLHDIYTNAYTLLSFA